MGDDNTGASSRLGSRGSERRRRTRANGLVNFVGPDGYQRVWAPLQLEDYRLDFRTAIVATSGSTVAYAVSYILSERDQTGLVLKVGSDYNAKISLNQGKSIAASTRTRWSLTARPCPGSN